MAFALSFVTRCGRLGVARRHNFAGSRRHTDPMPETSSRGNRAEESVVQPVEHTVQNGASLRSGILLRSLAPHYESAQHGSYVRHLNAVVTDPDVRNIALTGRYGSGKSSILDRFVREQESLGRKILRISINTLGPDKDEVITNRIQKELVKQLVYRAKPGEISSPRFARSAEPDKWRMILESLGASVVLLGLFRLFGVWPNRHALTPWDATPGILFVLVVLATVFAARWAIGDRLVSEFTTGGTSIKLEKRADTYFDEYLDEIMAFFDATEPDIVVFEDLDRFDDDRIFDSLRELNTLINASSHWIDRGTPGKRRPLRFVYAIKDSLFEQLGGAPKTKKLRKKASDKERRSIANGGVERANRTKFFEVVIPVVPFLSHSNARDLLTKVLVDLKLPQGTDISREVRDVIARYTTDMRLLLNICNEFVVFAERLLWIAKQNRAPGMTADDLFAMVAYKNFHLADFEKLPQRGSDLDALQARRRELVRAEIERLEQARRELARVNELQRQQAMIAQRLGDHLLAMQVIADREFTTFNIDGKDELPAVVHTASFWQRLAATGTLTVAFRQRQGASAYSNGASTLDRNQLSALFPDGMDPLQWREPDAEELASQRKGIDRDIAFLRGADFGDLAKDKRFTRDGETFGAFLDRTLKHDLARELVRRGFIDRYFAVNSAAFYGEFLGRDVAQFFHDGIEPNQMLVDFEFTTDNAIQNVIQQAPAGFTSSRSAFNVQVVDYLLQHRPNQAKEVVAFFVAEEGGDDARTFVDAFLSDAESRKEDLTVLLAQCPWRGLFGHLAVDGAVPDEATRTRLIDAAIRGAISADDYDLGDAAKQRIRDAYRDMEAFTAEQDAERTETVLGFARQAFHLLPELEVLAGPLRQRVITEGKYELTPLNLRSALDLSPGGAISLEDAWQDERVRQRCLEALVIYLDEVVDVDEATEHAVCTADVLREVITQCIAPLGDDKQDVLAKLLRFSAKEAALPDITAVPENTWPAIAAAHLMVPTAANAHTYATKCGVDSKLARLLTADDGQIVLQNEDKLDGVENHDLTVRILNASSVLKSSERASIAALLNPDGSAPVIEPAEIKPSGDDLLANLLAADLIPDTLETFQHFMSAAGWPAVAEAFAVSKNVAAFMEPALVSGHAADLLEANRVPHAVKKKVVEGLAVYVPADDMPGLRAAAEYANKVGITLQTDDVRKIAPAVQDEPELALCQLDADQSITPQQLLETLPLLGGDWSNFGQGSGSKFDVPDTELTKTILDRLKKATLVSSQKSRDRRKGQVL